MYDIVWQGSGPRVGYARLACDLTSPAAAANGQPGNSAIRCLQRVYELDKTTICSVPPACFRFFHSMHIACVVY